MTEFLVLTAIGEDRPGIVDDLTRVLLNAELNIEDSRMSVLGGEFAIILLIHGETDALKQIQQQKDQLETALKLNLLFKPTKAREAIRNKISYHLKVVGMDHPGIVHRLARFLSQRNINIEDLETESYPAPHTGTPMFAVNMTVDIPNELANSKLRDEFMELCDEQNLDAQFSPLQP
ncbi:MAG: glycine cleavage system protein R [Gammaproteobacteria bacterium]|nr:glycine cleavage system protein R [Gammaproteobacteria bacterium]